MVLKINWKWVNYMMCEIYLNAIFKQQGNFSSV